MDIAAWTDQRQTASRARRRPRPAHAAYFPVDGGGRFDATDGQKPTDVLIETTHPDGDTAAWFDDWWWMDCLARWKDQQLAMHVLPSPAALLHPVVLHHVEMARRMAPGWRMIGHCWLEEMDLDSSAEAIARSPYHEVRIIDAPMPETVGQPNPARPPKVQDLITRVRQMQRLIDRSLPTLVRSAAPPEA